MHEGCLKIVHGYLTADPPIARKLSRKEANITHDRTNYLPTHPVTNPNKPGKIRLVNDASTSLNKQLVTGPDLLSCLVGMILRFRTHPVAIAADVQDFFHRVRVSEKDADSLRFLWQDDIHSDDPPDTYQMLAHVFGATDSPTCANYALKRVARDNAADYDGQTVESALRSFYVDDFLKSVLTEEQGIKLSRELMSMLQKGDMRLTKFLSNSKKVLESIPESERSPSISFDIQDGEERNVRALGLTWNVDGDVFTFTTTLADGTTKRSILSITASLFDPVGFLAAFILVAKLILQELWRLGCQWDEVIDERVQKRWDKWLQGARNLPKIKINRQYLVTDKRVSEVQLHIFCDASELAFGCVAYLRFSFKSGGHASSFVMAKTKLAPIKTVTLPRLELNAARIGARLSRLVVHELDFPVERIQFWTDSMLTLQYINNKTKRTKVYVSNRVSDIADHSSPEQWAHLPGKLNPADVLSRGVDDPEELVNSGHYTGPKFLQDDEEDWPKTVIEELDANDPEIRKKPILVALGLMRKESTEGIDFSRMSSWLRLRRMVAWVIRFVHNCQVSREGDRMKGNFVPEDLEAAEGLILKDV